jgi:hypothetical protein
MLAPQRKGPSRPSTRSSVNYAIDNDLRSYQFASRSFFLWTTRYELIQKRHCADFRMPYPRKHRNTYDWLLFYFILERTDKGEMILLSVFEQTPNGCG